MSDRIELYSLVLLHGLISRGENISDKAIASAIQGGKDTAKALAPVFEEEDRERQAKTEGMLAVDASIRKRADPLELVILSAVQSPLHVAKIADRLREAFPASFLTPLVPTPTAPSVAPAPSADKITGSAPTTATGTTPAS